MAERLARLGGGGAVLTATTDSELITGLLASSALGLEKAALDVLPLLEGAFCLVFCDESTLCAARDAHGIHPLVLGRLGPAEAPTGWVVASETAALDIVGAAAGARGRGRRDAGHRRRRRPQPPLRHRHPARLHLRIRLPRPSRHHDRRPLGTRHPGRGRARARPRGPRRGRSRHPGSRLRHAGGHRLRRAERDPVRRRPGQERLRRPHVHPAVADDPPARHPAQAQPAARGHRRQATRRRRRLGRARQYPGGAGEDAARVRCCRGPRADQLAAGALALLLRHRLRHPRRAHRHRPRRRGDPRAHRGGFAGVRHARRARRGDEPAGREPVQGVLHRLVPGDAARPEPARQGDARDGQPQPRRRPDRRRRRRCRRRIRSAHS